MLTSARLLKVITVAVYLSAVVVAYLDLFIWRP